MTGDAKMILQVEQALRTATSAVHSWSNETVGRLAELARQSVPNMPPKAPIDGMWRPVEK